MDSHSFQDLGATELVSSDQGHHHDSRRSTEGLAVSRLVPDVFAFVAIVLLLYALGKGVLQFLSTGSTRELESSPMFASVKQSFKERFPVSDKQARVDALSLTNACVLLRG